MSLRVHAVSLCSSQLKPSGYLQRSFRIQHVSEAFRNYAPWTAEQNAAKAGHHHPRGRPGPAAAKYDYSNSTSVAADVSGTVDDDDDDDDDDANGDS